VSGYLDSEAQQVSPVDEGRYRELMTPRRVRWEARSLDPLLNERQARYARSRATALNRPYSARLASCATAGVVVKCHCPGRRDVRWFTCRSFMLCERCAKQRRRKLRKRFEVALAAAWDAAPARSHLVMVTLTQPHSGDVGRDRRELAAAWERFRKSYHHRWGSFPFLGVHEVTAGRDGLGHPHAHVVCVWPKGRKGDGTAGDWQLLRRLWVEACPGSEIVNFKPFDSAQSAAFYASKYVSKGFQGCNFTAQLRAEVLAGTYNTRWVFTSRKLWTLFVPLCPCCGHRVVRATFGWSSVDEPPSPSEDCWTDRLPRAGPDAQSVLAIPTSDERSGRCGS
jgi:hypothetical protein